MIVTSLTPIDDRSSRTTVATTTSETAPATGTVPPATDSVTLSEETTEHRLLMMLDEDGDGTVSKDDFVKSTFEHLRNAGRYDSMTTNEKRLAKHEAAWTRQLERKFEKADVNNDGSLDESEMAAMMARDDKRAHAMTMTDTKVRLMSVASVARALDRYRTAEPGVPSIPSAPSEPTAPAEPTEPVDPTEPSEG
jgi:Ca2+-binding EF-hand superfamily protein